MRIAWRMFGMLAVAAGVIGLFLPIMPTVPFMLLAAFCFARSNPEWEQRLLDDPRFGPPIRAWRERGAIGRNGKIGATLGLTGSAIMGLVFLPEPWRFAPLVIAILCGAWIVSRPAA